LTLPQGFCLPARPSRHGKQRWGWVLSVTWATICDYGEDPWIEREVLGVPVGKAAETMVLASFGLGDELPNPELTVEPTGHPPEVFFSIVIPAYNEEQRIGTTLDKIRNYLVLKPFTAEMVVVDDGSMDNTPGLLRAAAARWPQFRILTNPRNRGKGFSVRRGVLEAKGAFILFTDADPSGPIEEADKLMAALESGQADAAVASRALDRSLIGVR
jgi:hypothetical protein